MLDGYGLHELVWNVADEAFSGTLVASPADSRGRGIALAVREGGAPADLTGAAAYLVWRHRMTGTRGCEPFEEVDASEGRFRVFYPAAMAGAGGVADAQVTLSLGEGRYLSTRTLTIRIEPALVDGGGPRDGFTLFVGALDAYERAAGASTEAADAANEAAGAAREAAGAAGDATAAATDAAGAATEAAAAASGAATAAGDATAELAEAVERGDFDGTSPTASVEQTDEGATLTVSDRSGTTTATLLHGAKGDTGDTGPRGPQGATGATGRGIASITEGPPPWESRRVTLSAAGVASPARDYRSVSTRAGDVYLDARPLGFRSVSAFNVNIELKGGSFKSASFTRIVNSGRPDATVGVETVTRTYDEEEGAWGLDVAVSGGSVVRIATDAYLRELSSELVGDDVAFAAELSDGTTERFTVAGSADPGEAGFVFRSLSLDLGDEEDDEGTVMIVTYTDGATDVLALPTGPQGEPGDDYVLTAQDKADIAALVREGMTDGDLAAW